MFFGRSHNKVESPYRVKHFYSFYMNEVKDNPLYEIPYELYKVLVEEFYKRVVHEILYKNKSFDMPYSLGVLSVQKHKINVKLLGGSGTHTYDWKATVDLGKPVYHLNEHSHNYRYLFRWNRYKANRKNLSFYKLVMTRTNKRLLAKLIKSGKYDYFEYS